MKVAPGVLCEVVDPRNKNYGRFVTALEFAPAASSAKRFIPTLAANVITDDDYWICEGEDLLSWNGSSELRANVAPFKEVELQPITGPGTELEVEQQKELVLCTS